MWTGDVPNREGEETARRVDGRRPKQRGRGDGHTHRVDGRRHGEPGVRRLPSIRSQHEARLHNGADAGQQAVSRAAGCRAAVEARGKPVCMTSRPHHGDKHPPIASPVPQWSLEMGGRASTPPHSSHPRPQVHGPSPDGVITGGGLFSLRKEGRGGRKEKGGGRARDGGVRSDEKAPFLMAGGHPGQLFFFATGRS